MVDIYMQELMNGRIKSPHAPHSNQKPPKITDRFELECEKELELIVNSIPEEELSQSNLETKNSRIDKKKLEIKEELFFAETNKYIELAISTLTSCIELEEVEREHLELELFEAAKLIENLNLATDFYDQNLKEILHISTRSVDLIFSLAIKKYINQETELCLSLFLLLSNLIPENADLWYRAALAAQMSNKIEFALKLYCQSLAIDSESIGAKIFSIECNLILGFKDKAGEMYRELKGSVNEQNIEERWAMLLFFLNDELSALDKRSA